MKDLFNRLEQADTFSRLLILKGFILIFTLNWKNNVRTH